MKRALLAPLALALALVSVFASPAAANRVALVIGISGYEHLAPLKNPVPDAKAIAALLKKSGFVVSEHYDLSRADFLDAVEAFKEAADKASVALVYFAGHGMEIGGKNILAPKDVEISCQPKKARRAFRLQRLFEAVQGAPKQIVLLDACRNDPFPQCPTRSARAGSGFRGLSRLATEDSSVLIANATLSGQLAADGEPGRHSPFAKALLARFSQNPRLYLRDLLDLTAQDVRLATRGAQIPEITSRGGAPRICLAGEGCGTGGAAPAPAATVSVAEVRSLLAELGYGVGTQRGGAGLEAAVKAFQTSAGLPADGRITPTLLAVLKATKTRLAALPKPPGKPAIGIPTGPLEHEVGATFKDCDGCPEMVVVPAGRFQMGSAPGERGRQANEGPSLPVQFARPFAVAKFEITFDDWEACALEGGCNGYRPKDNGWGRGRRPVIYVSFDDAKAYVAWLRSKTGKSYRLLSEAEWEFAARGGTTTAFATGRSIGPTQANFDASNPGTRKAKGLYRGKTVEVGSFPANPFGLHDMHGNVSEWVADCWNTSHAGAPGDGSPRGGKCERRVLKGGSWYFEAAFVRSAARVSYPKKSRQPAVGFRVARALE